MTYHAMTAEKPFDRVKRLASEAGWDRVLGDLYPALGEAINNGRRGRHLHCTCPVHGTSNKNGRGDGFRVLDDFRNTGGTVCNSCGAFPTGIDTICFLEHRENDHMHALKILEDYFGIGREKSSPRPIQPRQKVEEPSGPTQEEITKRMNLLKMIWGKSVPLSELDDDDHAIRYWTETRGIDDVALIKSQKHIRFNRWCFYSRSDQEDVPPICYPAFVSMYHGPDGAAVGLHQNYLHPTEPRKAPVEDSRKSLGNLVDKLNGAIRITGRVPFSSHANVCEGVETGMAIVHSIGHPMYAAGYTSLMASWVPPEGTRCVTIWADRDKPDRNNNMAGLLHAKKLAARMIDRGLAVRILEPNFLDAPKEDWNDVLLKCGFEAIAQAYAGQSDHTIYHE